MTELVDENALPWRFRPLEKPLKPGGGTDDVQQRTGADVAEGTERRFPTSRADSAKHAPEGWLEAISWRWLSLVSVGFYVSSQDRVDLRLVAFPLGAKPS